MVYGNFYYPFNIFGTVWFIAGPAFILSANTYIDKWVRESVVCAVLLFISFGGHLMFLVSIAFVLLKQSSFYLVYSLELF
ncbi:hypothetical protein NQ314_004493 [Rhamnusium bicolor]|uniref:GPR180/TMEM145 transmembrane domain-containing protein n=1 Tax=Rhamnusium bicolor TaxID=1586634 RepID=A0AAV8ZM46_9CUCU|nr:hypothetical protein NQ314_004493 [Rhamnusium bicolor]